MSILQPGTLLRCIKYRELYDGPECLYASHAVNPSDYVLFLEFVLHKATREDDWLYHTIYNPRFAFTASAKVLVNEQVLYIRGVSLPYFFQALNVGENHKSWSQKTMNTIFQQVSTNLKVYFETVESI